MNSQISIYHSITNSKLTTNFEKFCSG